MYGSVNPQISFQPPQCESDPEPIRGRRLLYGSFLLATAYTPALVLLWGILDARLWTVVIGEFVVLVFGLASLLGTWVGYEIWRRCRTPVTVLCVNLAGYAFIALVIALVTNASLMMVGCIAGPFAVFFRDDLHLTPQNGVIFTAISLPLIWAQLAHSVRSSGFTLAVTSFGTAMWCLLGLIATLGQAF